MNVVLLEKEFLFLYETFFYMIHNSTIYSEQLSQIISPLVLSGKYKDEETALKDIVLEHITHKINKYKSCIETFRKKYNVDFKGFGKYIKNRASFDEEDDWMDWKSAIEMENAWKITLKKTIEHVH